MKRSLLLSLVVASVACAPAAPVATGVTPAPPATALLSPFPPAPPIPLDTAPRSALPRNWQLLDETADHIAGISSERALRELVAGKQPSPVVVAVIDAGVDTAHVDLKANLWINPKNTANDDRYGYVGDVHGWDFIGGRDGRDVDQDTYEVTRLYAGCTSRIAATHGSLPAPEQARCDKIAADYNKQKRDAESELPNIQNADKALTMFTQVLRQATGKDSLTDDIVEHLQPSTPQVQQAKAGYLQLGQQGITRSVIDGALKEINGQLQHALNPDFNPRPIVGDDTTDINQRNYGNADVMGPDADHGTHVSGIIAAVRGNGIGIDGIAPAVRIMAVRAVPDGDERDKDIANAIRYAVDNGARIINMSFGKPYSPGKAAVDAAVQYADEHGVLMVHAAGNDGQNSDSIASFPNPYYLAGGRAQNWIEVGASSWRGGDSLAASFSNYGRARVDLFAPGVDILSTIPHDKYDRYSGTSMATPVVVGVAALVMSYYPSLSAAEVKRILARVGDATSGSDGRAPRTSGSAGAVRAALRDRRNRERLQRAQNGG